MIVFVGVKKLGFFLKNYSKPKYCAIEFIQDHAKASLVTPIGEFLNLS